MKRLLLSLLLIIFALPMMSLQAQNECNAGDYEYYSAEGSRRLWAGDYQAAVEAFDCGMQLAPSSDSFQLPLVAPHPYTTLFINRAWSNLMLGNVAATHEDFYQWLVLTEAETFATSLDLALANPLPMRKGLVYRINFDGRAGEMWSFSSLEASNTITDPLFVLLGPEGVMLTSDDDNGASAEQDGDYQSVISDTVLPYTGTYTLVIGQAGLANTGAIELNVERPVQLN